MDTDERLPFCTPCKLRHRSEKEPTPNIVKKYRQSTQRTQILSYLRESNEHPTAIQVFKDLKPLIPSLSLGNLYRNLGILVAQGEIIKLKLPGSAEDRFDGHTEEHFHFVCDGCGTFLDVEPENYPDLKELFASKEGWQIKNLDINVRGICPKCKNLTNAARTAE